MLAVAHDIHETAVIGVPAAIECLSNSGVPFVTMMDLFGPPRLVPGRFHRRGSAPR